MNDDLEELCTADPRVAAISYNLLFTNDLCCCCVIDCLSLLEKSKYYRHETKRIAKAASKERHIYESRMGDIMRECIDKFADSNENFFEKIDNDIEIMYLCIKKSFDKLGVEDSFLFARIGLALVMCEFSCVQLRDRVKELSGIDRRFKHMSVAHLDLSRLTFFMGKLLSSLPAPEIDLTDDAEFSASFTTIKNKLMNPALIAEAIKANIV